MKFKCFTCGEEIEVHKYSCSVEYFGGGFLYDPIMKKETSSYRGRCSKCETDFQITSEQVAYERPKEKEDKE